MSSGSIHTCSDNQVTLKTNYFEFQLVLKYLPNVVQLTSLLKVFVFLSRQNTYIKERVYIITQFCRSTVKSNNYNYVKAYAWHIYIYKSYIYLAYNCRTNWIQISGFLISEEIFFHQKFVFFSYKKHKCFMGSTSKK